MQPEGPARFEWAGPPQEAAVRDGVKAFATWLKGRGHDLVAADAELAVAEAMNNLAEHGFEDAAKGRITLTAGEGAGGVLVALADNGRGAGADFMAATALPLMEGELPEGGFGLFLIGNLCSRLEYVYRPGANVLTMEFGADRPS